MPKKKLKIDRDVFYAAVLLSCGPPPGKARMVFHLGSPMDRAMFGDWCARSPWWKQFTHCVTAAGEAKSRSWIHLKGFIRWHEAAVIRVEMAESTLKQLKENSA